MSVRERRLTLRCDMCSGSSKPGLIWLGGRDYVECPQCAGAGTMPLVERLTTPGRSFVSAGIPQPSLLTVTTR